MDDEDLLGRRETGRRLGIALAVAVILAVVEWNLLTAGPLADLIARQSGFGREKAWIDLGACVAVFATYLATYAILGRRANRRWHARVPTAITRSR